MVAGWRRIFCWRRSSGELEVDETHADMRTLTRPTLPAFRSSIAPRISAPMSRVVIFQCLPNFPQHMSRNIRFFKFAVDRQHPDYFLASDVINDPRPPRLPRPGSAHRFFRAPPEPGTIGSSGCSMISFCTAVYSSSVSHMYNARCRKCFNQSSVTFSDFSCDNHRTIFHIANNITKLAKSSNTNMFLFFSVNASRTHPSNPSTHESEK